jgi:hypothetical protein
MFANTVLNKWAESIEKAMPTIELIVFDIGEVSFGIPITKIDRIISNIHLGEDYTLTQHVEILDLYDRLFGVDISNPTAIAIYRGDGQQLYGIPIDTVPTLILVPLDRIRTLPSDFRTTNPLGIASHIAMISDLTTDSTIFVLGS